MKSIKKALKRAVSHIVEPVTAQFPFFAINFMLLTVETWHIIIRQLPGLFRLQWPAIMDNLVTYLLIGFLVSYTMSAIVVACPTRIRRPVKVLFYGCTVTLFGIELFLELCFHTVFSPNLLMVVGETTAEEMCEFWSTFGLTVEALTAYLTVTLMIACIKLCEQHRRPLKPRRSVVVWLFVGIVLLLGAAIHSCRIFHTLYSCRFSSELEATQEFSQNNTGMDEFTNLLYSIHAVDAAENETAIAVASTAKVAGTAVHCDDSVTLVLVIGESYIKWHSQLYGYPLETTPTMLREVEAGRLFVFDDAVSPYNTTSITLKNVLFTNRLSRGEKWYESPFFPTVFRHAGYKVCYWDNQRTFGVTGGYSLDSLLYSHRMAAMSYDECNSRPFTYDMELIDDYIGSHSDLGTRQLVVFHLMGQHVSPSSRFPHEARFVRFTADSIRRTDRSRAERQYIADYDNATRYNDMVIGRIFDYCRDGNAVVVYFSDHGEEAYDFRRQIGRQNDRDKTRNILRYHNAVPFVVWCSDTFIRLHPAIVERLETSTHQPFMTDVVSQLLFHLVSITTPYYRASDDPISAEFIPMPRIVYGHFDYDSICRQTNNK